MKRIVIIGCGGSGKTTLARKLASKLHLPHIQLDYYYWLPGWKEVNYDLFQNDVERLCKQPAWIMDGTYVRTLHTRCAAADVIIFLDFPRSRCLWGILKRYVVSFFKKRTGYPPGYTPTLNWGFLKYAWRFPTTFRPIIINTLKFAEESCFSESSEGVKKSVRIVILRNRRDVANFLKTIEIDAVLFGSL